MKTLTDLTKELGELLEDKDKKYGSSTTVSGTMLRLLYPEGVPVNQYQNVTLLVRIFDKMKRIATGASDENSWQDIAGYGVQGWKQTVNQAEAEEVLFKIKQYEQKHLKQTEDESVVKRHHYLDKEFETSKDGLL